MHPHATALKAAAPRNREKLPIALPSLAPTARQPIGRIRRNSEALAGGQRDSAGYISLVSPRSRLKGTSGVSRTAGAGSLIPDSSF